MAVAPTPIDYNTFLANAQAADVRALAFLAAAEPIRTLDPTEAATFRSQLDRLYGAGMITRNRESREVIGTDTWYVFDARVHPDGLNHLAKCAMERLTLSRAPIPTTPAP